tara:strand:- start:909 stop:1280 length:372 start_codon:yes stop_codon:yes gene_type:complete
MREELISFLDKPFEGDILANREDDRFIGTVHVVTPRVCKITAIKTAILNREKKEFPYAVLEVNGKPCKRFWQIRCKAVQDAMIHITGETQTQKWVGAEIELYCDPDVTLMGETVGGVRVRKPS